MLKIPIDKKRLINEPYKIRNENRKKDEKRDEHLTEPESVHKITNLSYGPHGVENLLDIYYPKDTKDELPTIVSVHGGGFFYGDKEIYKFYTMFLSEQGFTVVNFNYRLAPESKYPSTLEDINNLMKWIVDHHKEYNIDLNNLFLVGDSAGGQLVEQYTTILNNKKYQSLFDFTVANVQFNAIALNCSLFFLKNNKFMKEDFSYYFEKKSDVLLQEQFPVESFLNENFPPTFVMTASHDFLRDLSEPFVNILKEKKIQFNFSIYENKDKSRLGHVFHINQKSDIAKKCNMEEINFFRKYIN